jgi:hypothetical protein
MDAFEEHRKSGKAFDVSLFSDEERVLIDLLHTLKKLRTPLKAYSEILKWAVRSTSSGYSFREGPQTSRKFILSKMQSRMYQDKFTPHEHALYLPYSQAHVNVVYFDAKEVLHSLLTCPMLNKDDNYMFHDTRHPDTCNPFAKPDGRILSDINTGRSYLKTYDKLIKDPSKDMLLPCILAIDKTHCDSGGSRLQMEPLTISHGLLRHNIRKDPAAVRILGYINLSPLHKSDDPPTANPPSHSNGEHLPKLNGVSAAAYSLNEYHLQLRCILEKSGFLSLQDRGFTWKLEYRGQLIPVVFHPYVPFIIGDTEGHDRLCGHYTSRGKGVLQLCRVCECPAELSGDSKARDHRKRTPVVVNRMVRHRRLDSLSSSSQQYLKNAFDDIRFGFHNRRGIFGACPGEILHMVLLGWFKYAIESFFVQAGSQTGETVKSYNTLCNNIGRQLQRQSDRKVPRTMFRKGFSTTPNLKGHEYRGCLLVILISLYTSRYQEIFSTPVQTKKVRLKKGKPKRCHSKKGRLGDINRIKDWKLLVSSLLQWHEWLKKPFISRESARKSGKATSWLMRTMKTVAPRHTGMKNNTIKMHLVHHIGEDILDFGVPQNVNSAFAESAHIHLAKITSKNTQRRPETFTLQAAERYVENLTIERSHIEFQPLNPLLSNTQTKECRRQFIIWMDLQNTCHYRFLPWQQQQLPLEAHLLDRLEDVLMEERVKKLLVHHCLPHVVSSRLHCFTEFLPRHHPSYDSPADAGQLYRANPNYQGKPWYDHAMVRWDGFKLPLPARIHTFINLEHLKPNATISFPGSDQGNEPTIPGTYAVIESFERMYEFDTLLQKMECEQTDIDNPSIFRLFRLTTGKETGLPVFFLVHTDCIMGPTIGMQDIRANINSKITAGVVCPNNRYIFMTNRQSTWGDHWNTFILNQYYENESPEPESDSDAESTETFA